MQPTAPPPDAGAAASTGKQLDDPAPPACASLENNAPAPPGSLGSEFLGSVSHQCLQPSAPPPPPGELRTALAAAEAASCEVHLDEGGLVLDARHNLGALQVYTPSWGPSYLLRRRPYLLVLRHPSDPSRGLLLQQGADPAEVASAGRRAGENLGLQGAHRVEVGVYNTLRGDPALRASVVAPPEDGIAMQAGASASSAAAGAATAAGAALHQEDRAQACCGDCPICFGEIESSSAVMRCSGEGGVHHYFHSGCMQQWIQQCRRGSAGASCPVCRGRLQFHAQRLDAFLAGGQSAGLTAEDRGFLQECAERLRGGIDWGEVFTLENAKYWGGLAAAGGWGFMIGYGQPPPTLQYQLTLSCLPREHRIAQGVGWTVGLVTRLVRDYQRSKAQRRLEDERSRR